jgi:microcystin-dependent protein
MDGSFLGEVKLFAGNFAPRSWMLCNGAMLSIAQNTALFSLLGTTYGGDGVTTFSLPDFRGRMPVGFGSGPGLTPRNYGDMSGVENVTLVSTNMPMHTHQQTPPTVSVTAGGTGTADIYAYAGNADTGVAAAGVSFASVNAGGRGAEAYPTFNAASAPDVKLNAATIQNVQVPAPTVTFTGTPMTGTAGGSQPHDNMTPFLCMIYIICTEGIYPSRP